MILLQGEGKCTNHIQEKFENPESFKVYNEKYKKSIPDGKIDWELDYWG